MSELLLLIMVGFFETFVVQVLLQGPGQLALVLFKQRKFSDDPDGTAVCLSLLFWLVLGVSIWLIVSMV